MKSTFNNLITSLMKTGNSSFNTSADRIRRISDEITNELVFDKEDQGNFKSKFNSSNENHMEFIDKQNASEIITTREVKKKDVEADKWAELKKVGAGLRNQGNTCFLNSTLQCLIYSRALFNHLLSVKHSCTSKLCMVCELRSLAKACLLQNNSVVSPISILKKLKQIALHMRWGSQEDAHEFLRHVIDSLHRCSVHKNPSKRPSPVLQLFGGLLKSQIVCMQCNKESIKLDPFMDVSLEVKGVPSLEAGLARFTKSEILEGDNAYLCKNCKKKVKAKKRFLFYRLPKILTIQFKRYSMGGGKVSNHISFPNSLSLQPFTQDNSLTAHQALDSLHNSHSKTNHNPSNHQINNSPCNKHHDDGHNQSSDTSLKARKSSIYQLYAVLVHEGHSTSSGHYYSYIRAPNDVWYCMNDSHVFQTSLNHVLKAQAYVLFYQRTHKPSNASATPNSKLIHPAKKTPVTATLLTKASLPTLSSSLSSSHQHTNVPPTNVTPTNVTPSKVTPSKVTPSKVTPSKVTPSKVTPSKPTKSLKPFTLSFNDLMKKKDKQATNPPKPDPLNIQSDSLGNLQIVGKSIKSSSSLSPSPALQAGSKMRGGEVREAGLHTLEKAHSNVDEQRRHQLDTVKYTTTWKVKPFVIKSSSDNGSAYGGNVGSGVGGVGGKKGLLRRSSSGVWRVEKMKREGDCAEIMKRHERMNGGIKNGVTNRGRDQSCVHFDKSIEEGRKKVLQNGLEGYKEEKSFSNKTNGKSLNKYEDCILKKNKNSLNEDAQNADGGDGGVAEEEMKDQKQDISVRKPVVQCATFKWDSSGQQVEDKRKDEMKKKQKKMDLERLSDAAFSIPVSTWDGLEGELNGREGEGMKRDHEGKKKRKYEEMDEEIDSGRVKKVKTKKHSFSMPHFNPFQVWQNKKLQQADNGEFNRKH